LTAAGVRVSTRHAFELRQVERFVPLQTALGEHFELWRNQFGPVQAAEHDEDEAGETIQIGTEQSGAAIGAEVAVQSLAGLRDIVMRFRLAADHGEIILRHAEECGHLAARRSLAVQAVAIGDEVRVGVELELHRTTSTLSRVFLSHASYL